MKQYADDNIVAFVFRNLKRGDKILVLEDNETYINFLKESGYEVIKMSESSFNSKLADGAFSYLGLCDISVNNILDNSKKFLKDGAICVFCFIKSDDFRADRLKSFSKEDIRDLLRGFEILNIENITFTTQNMKQLNDIYIVSAKRLKSDK